MQLAYKMQATNHPLPKRPVQMTHFELPFKYAGYQHVALVTEMHGEESNQYTLSPKDEKLLQKYGSQIVHVFHDNDRPAIFHVRKEEELAFWGAVGLSLHQKLKSSDL
jgi:hypothetical protein